MEIPLFSNRGALLPSALGRLLPSPDFSVTHRAVCKLFLNCRSDFGIVGVVRKILTTSHCFIVAERIGNQMETIVCLSPATRPSLHVMPPDTRDYSCCKHSDNDAQLICPPTVNTDNYSQGVLDAPCSPFFNQLHRQLGSFLMDKTVLI